MRAVTPAPRQAPGAALTDPRSDRRSAQRPRSTAPRPRAPAAAARGGGRGGEGVPSAERIVATAMRHFAEAGYEAVRVEAVAAEAGMAKGSVFFHFGSKRGLFLAAYRSAAGSLPRYLDAPMPVQGAGFFEVVRYWLARTEHLVREDWIPYRMTLLGTYCTDPDLRRDINRFLAAEDPFGTIALIQFGTERGEVRSDVDRSMVASLLDWLMDKFQDALVTDELAPGLLARHGDFALRNQARIDQFVGLLGDAIGAKPVGPGGT